jgi:DNA-directed RNA polymerase I subunit RPA1
LVYEVPGITHATVTGTLTTDGRHIVLTEHANMAAIIKRPDVDMGHFYTNNIANILDTFGTEAARAVIIKEVTAVFDAYGIAVDKRHLLLFVDYVTHSGEWVGMSRYSMKTCASPIQQMLFETTVQFLTQATLHG